MTMRIGVFTDNDFGKINGVTTALRAVVLHAPSDLQVRIYTASAVPVEREDYLALRAVSIPVPYYPGMDMCLPRFSRFLAIARRDRLDLVHYTTPGPMGLVAQYVAWRLGVPMVGSFHTQLAEYTALLSGSQRLGELMRKYLRWPYGRCQHVLVPSTSTRDLLVTARVAPGKLQIWSRGVDTNLFDPARRSPEMRASWGVDDRTPVVVYAGRISVEKNLRILPELWRCLADSVPEARLVVAGEGPLHAELARALAKAVFTGPLTQEALAVVMASADAFVFPSRTDTLGNVVLEAQASGLPVLVTDAGGPQENLIDGETGLVCRGTPDAAVFASRLAPLLRDRSRREAMGRAARRYACTRTWRTSLHPLYAAWRDAVTAARESSAGLSTVADARQR